MTGYAQWQVDRSQDEVFLATQEAAGQHRDAQGKPNKRHTEANDKEFTVNFQSNVQLFPSIAIHRMPKNSCLHSFSQIRRKIETLQSILFALNVDRKLFICASVAWFACNADTSENDVKI